MINKSTAYLLWLLWCLGLGGISMTDAVIELNKPTSEVRSILETVCADGLMEMANHESTGAVIYRLL